MLDRAGSLVESDRIAAAEGPIEDDRKGGEQIGEDALRGQADGDATHAKTRDEAGDVDAEIVEDEAESDREQRDRHEQTDNADRGTQRAAFVLCNDEAMAERSDEHPSELQYLMPNSYSTFR